MKDILPSAISLHEIADPSDPLLCFWLTLLQRQFPADEQESAGSVLKLVQQKEKGDAEESHLFVALSATDDAPVGMAQYDVETDQDAALLWYLAVAPGMEGKGYGSLILADIVQRVWSKEGCTMLVLEVERADGHAGAETPEQREKRLENIQQRDRFYIDRHNAQRLTGVEYYQQVDGFAPIPMDLLIIPNPGAEPQEVEPIFQRCKAIFGKSLRQIGTLALTRGVGT